MNDLLKELAINSGAPNEVLDELWFNIFCQKFADQIITLMENEDDTVEN
jgi:hypothetical protein